MNLKKQYAWGGENRALRARVSVCRPANSDDDNGLRFFSSDNGLWFFSSSF